jgi:triosephosphate isomerase
MRKKIAAANWKMNCTLQEATLLLNNLQEAQIKLPEHQLTILAVPFPYLIMAKEVFANNASVQVAAQNCYTKNSGAYTGEVSAAMLNSIGISYVIVGHSERREYFNETNAMLAEKVNIALANNVTPIFCCGEALSVREANEQNSYVEQQIKESLFHLTPQQIQQVIIAYEPIWAIGTGKTASTEQAQEMHHHLRNVLANQYSVTVANEISILYGGSVKAANAVELFSQSDVDGGLVGGASLQANEFLNIIAAL